MHNSDNLLDSVSSLMQQPLTLNSSKEVNSQNNISIDKLSVVRSLDVSFMFKFNSAIVLFFILIYLSFLLYCYYQNITLIIHPVIAAYKPHRAFVTTDFHLCSALNSLIIVEYCGIAVS